MHKLIDEYIDKYLPELKVKDWVYNQWGCDEYHWVKQIGKYKIKGKKYVKSLEDVKQFEFSGLTHSHFNYCGVDFYIYIKEGCDLDMTFSLIRDSINADILVRKVVKETEDNIRLYNKGEYREVYRNNKIEKIL